MLFRCSFLFVIVALAVKLVAIFYTNFDLFGDEGQYWLWSKNLDFGYYSKPPLLAWFLGFFTLFFGDSFESLKIFPILAYLISSLSIFYLSFEIYNNKRFAIICGLSFFLLPAVTVSSFLISTDILLIIFWSISMLFLLKIRKEPRSIYFFLLGIFLGLSFLTKYAAVYFFIGMLFVFVFDSKIRNSLTHTKTNIFIFIITILIIAFPNILWNIKNNWVTFSHTGDNAGLDRISINFFQGFEFLLIQAVMIGPVIFFSYLFFLKKIKLNFETIFLLSFSLPILIIVFVEGILVRANANWAAVALVSFFILFARQVYFFSKKLFFLNNLVNFFVSLLFFYLVGTTSNLSFFDRIRGISAFSESLEEKHLGGFMYLVVEDRLLYSNLSYTLKNANKTLLMPYKKNKKISNHFQITNPLDEGFKINFVYIGDPKNLLYLNKNKSVKKIESINTLFQKGPINIYEISF